MCLGEKADSEHFECRCFNSLRVSNSCICSTVPEDFLTSQSNCCAPLSLLWYFIWWDHKEADTKACKLRAFHPQETKGKVKQETHPVNSAWHISVVIVLSAGLSDSLIPGNLLVSLSQLSERFHSGEYANVKRGVERSRKESKEKNMGFYLKGGKQHFMYLLWGKGVIQLVRQKEWIHFKNCGNKKWRG